MYTLSLKEYKNLFHKSYSGLCLFANSYVDDIELSKDIVQTAFIKIWEDQIEFRNEYSVKSYLYTAVKNRSLDHLKSKHFKRTDRIDDLHFDQIEKESVFLREITVAETSQLIENAVQTLPTKCAQIIRLAIKEYSNAEIADTLKISINTVKTQKKIAYKRLRPILKDYFILIGFIFDW